MNFASRFQGFIVLKHMWNNTNVTQTRFKQTSLELATRIHGPGPTPNNVPIIVLHGLLGSKTDWESMCRRLTAVTNRTVIAVDARNHGDSPHSDSHQYTDLAADVSKLLTKFSINKGIIVGHSMGGRTAMVLALTEPTKVASLVVVDISPVSTAGSLSDFSTIMGVMQSVNFEGLNDLDKAKNAAREKFKESGVLDHMEGMMDFILMNVGKLPNKSYGWKCNVDALLKNFNSIASFPNMSGKRYIGTTLFLAGRLSYFIPPEDLPGIRNMFPKAHLHYVEGAGHNLHAEAPNNLFNLVMQFLSYTQNECAKI